MTAAAANTEKRGARVILAILSTVANVGAGQSVRIAVAMTTCDSGRFLQPQLDSILDQRRPPDALIVSDDASNDGTLDRLRAFAAASPFPTTILLNEARAGVHRNSAKALLAAAKTCDIVVPAGHDDLWAVEKLSAIEEAFSGRPDLSLWFSDADFIDADGNPLGMRLSDLVTLRESDLAELRRGGGVRRLLHGSTISGGTSAVRADIIRTAVLPFPEDTDGRYPYFWEDAWIALVARLMGEFATDERCLLHYRRHTGQLSEREPDERSRSRLAARRDQRVRQRIATGIIASRIRDRPDLAWVPVRAEEVLALDDFLTARTMPRLSTGRIRELVAQLHRGSYRRFARGTRTFAADLLGL